MTPQLRGETSSLTGRRRCLLAAWPMMISFPFVVVAAFAFRPPVVFWTATTTNGEPVLASRRRTTRLFLSDNWNKDSDSNNNPWASSDDEGYPTDDWQDTLSQKEQGTFWTTFEPSLEGSENEVTNNTLSNERKGVPDDDEVDDSEAWLDALRQLTSEEVEFNLREADRADKARQMEEWGFTRETITNALDLAMDTSLETVGEVEGMQAYRQDSFWDDVEMETVESHTQVEIELETGEPVRSQMVYVDEHTCIGCTNCASVAQSTFFMQQEHGRARVFQQWGDTDETIQIAIETCPVDCIHYVPFDELVSLEKDRRNQNINFKARLVSQAENGNSLSHLSGGGSNAFTAPQQISGNMRSRCNNCPSRGCGDCPMYGVGRNPEYERKEKDRQQRSTKRKLQQQRERDQKTAEL